MIPLVATPICTFTRGAVHLRGIEEAPRREAVSVLLPVRNGLPHLRRAVESCLEDMSPDDELLVLENGSTDDTPEVLRQLSAEDARVRVLTTGAPNLAQALNVGLREARHDLLARMDADDVTLPHRFASQVREMAADPRLVLCGTQIRRFSTRVEASRSVSDFPVDHDEIVSGLLRGRHVLCHPSVLFRRHAAVEVGGYWAEGLSEDCDFFLRLSRVGRLTNTREVGLAYRYHGDSLNARRQVELLLGMRYAAETYLQDRSTIPSFDQYRTHALASRTRRLQLRRQALSDSLYRAAQVRILSGEPTVLGHLQLFTSGLLRPGRAARRVLALRGGTSWAAGGTRSGVAPGTTSPRRRTRGSPSGRH